MTVAADGTAYVTQFGFDTWGGTTGRLASSIIAVAPDGTVSVAADDIICPNGIAFDALRAAGVRGRAGGDAHHPVRPGRRRHRS